MIDTKPWTESTQVEYKKLVDKVGGKRPWKDDGEERKRKFAKRSNGPACVYTTERIGSFTRKEANVH